MTLPQFILCPGQQPFPDQVWRLVNYQEPIEKEDLMYENRFGTMAFAPVFPQMIGQTQSNWPYGIIRKIKKL